MHVRVAGPGRTCTLILASLSGANNQNKQDAAHKFWICITFFDMNIPVLLTHLHDIIAKACGVDNAHQACTSWQHSQLHALPLSVCLYVCLSVYLSVCLSVGVQACVSACVRVPVFWSVSVSASLSACLCVYLSACVFVCLGVQKFGTGALRPSIPKFQ